MSKRSERKNKADKRRTEIAEELRQYMAEVAGTTEDKYSWSTVLREAEEWLRRRRKMFPQEAHMYLSGARQLQRELVKILKEKKGGEK